MMSRATYKGLRIEWSPDECSQDLPKAQYISKKANPPPPIKKLNPMINRFQMLNIDGTEDGSDDGEEDDLTSFSSRPAPTHWASAAVVA